MSSNIRLAPVSRWRVTGCCVRSQGADGVETLAREAYASMLASEWEPDFGAATMPVHDSDRDRPDGQAYKCVWGYDKATRTEWSSCGAECYTFRVPADALDDTNAGGAALVQSVAIRLAGDRYLDAGARVWCELSASAAPSPVAAAVTSADGAAHLATRDQVDADGTPLTPNKREGVERNVSVAMGGAAPARYLHVHLILADYLSVRGAWIEGGAMFAGEHADVSFSRDVAEDADDAGESCALDVGRVTFGDAVTPAYAVQHLPRASVWEICEISCNTVALEAEVENAFATRVSDVLAFVRSAPALWAHEGMVAAAATVRYGQSGKLKVGESSAKCCCLCAHGHTGRRRYRGMAFATPLPGDIPYRLCVYGIGADFALAATVFSDAAGVGQDAATTYSPRGFATPLVHWSTLLSRAFRDGAAATVRCVTDPTLSQTTMASASAADTEEVEVVPLAARTVTSPIGRVLFDRPFDSGELSSVLVALIPDGAPSGTVQDTVEQYDAAATRSVVAAIPAAATRTPRQAVVSIDTLIDGGDTVSDDNPPCGILFRIDANIDRIMSTAFPGFGVTYHDEVIVDGEAHRYSWNSVAMGVPSLWSRDGFSEVLVDGVRLAFDYGGRRYRYDTDDGDPVPRLLEGGGFVRRANLFVQSVHPGGEYGKIAAILNLSQLDGERFGFRIAAHADDGDTIQVLVSFSDRTLSFMYSERNAFFGPEEFAYSRTRFLYTRIAPYYTPGDFDELSATVTDERRFDYRYTSAAAETAVAEVTQSGTVAFRRGGVTYVAAYSQTNRPVLGLAAKTTGALVPDGADATETATVYGVVHEVAQRLMFRGDDGSVVWASVVLPHAELSGDIPYRAKTAYVSGRQGVGTVRDDGGSSPYGDGYTEGLHGSASVREGYVEADVDPGLITLFE